RRVPSTRSLRAGRPARRAVVPRVVRPRPADRPARPGRRAGRGRTGPQRREGGCDASPPRLGLRQADGAPPSAPPPRRPIETAGTAGTAAAAATVVRQAVRSQLIPVALDEQKPARVAPRAAALAVVHVAGVGVPDAVAPRDGARARE